MSFWDQLTESLREAGRSLGEWVPKIIGALIVFIIGWIIARFLRRIIRKFFELPGVVNFFEKVGIEGALRNTGYTSAKLVANFVYIFLMLFVLLLTFQALGVQPIVDLLERFIAFLPFIFVAIAIVLIATWVGRLVADLVRPWAESQNMTWLPQIVLFGFALFGVITALNLLNIGLVANIIVTSFLGGLGIAFAIAFGIGGIDTAKKWWNKYLSPRET